MFVRDYYVDAGRTKRRFLRPVLDHQFLYHNHQMLCPLGRASRSVHFWGSDSYFHFNPFLSLQPLTFTFTLNLTDWRISTIPLRQPNSIIADTITTKRRDVYSSDIRRSLDVLPQATTQSTIQAAVFYIDLTKVSYARHKGCKSYEEISLSAELRQRHACDQMSWHVEVRLSGHGMDTRQKHPGIFPPPSEQLINHAFEASMLNFRACCFILTAAELKKTQLS